MILGTKPIWCSNKIFGLWRWTSSIFTKDLIFTREQLINVYKIYIPERKKNKDFDATSDWLWPQYNQTGYKSYEYEQKNLEIKNQKPILFNSIENSSQFFSLIMHLQKWILNLWKIACNNANVALIVSLIRL